MTMIVVAKIISFLNATGLLFSWYYTQNKSLYFSKASQKKLLV